MRVVYSGHFVKDLKRLRGQAIFEKIKILAFETVPLLDDLSTVTNLRKLQGHSSAYRIRVGDYRSGLTLNGETATFLRVLHRKDVYRFP